MGGRGQSGQAICFGLHPTSMISKHSTIPVPDIQYAPRKISYTFHFWHKSFILDDVKLAELLSNNSFEWKNLIFLGGQNNSDSSYIFSGVNSHPNPQDLPPGSKYNGMSVNRWSKICPPPSLSRFREWSAAICTEIRQALLTFWQMQRSVGRHAVCTSDTQMNNETSQPRADRHINMTMISMAP